MSHSLATQEQAPSVALLMPEIGTTQEQTIAQPVGDVQEEVVRTNSFTERVAEVAKNNLRPIAASLALVGAVGINAVNSEPVSAKSNNSWRESSCKAGDINTVVCTQSKKQAERYCAITSMNSPNPTRGDYIKGSRSKYKISVIQGDITGCDPMGKRKISLYQERKVGDDGEFRKFGTTSRVSTNNKFARSRIVKAAYKCKSGETVSVRPVMRIEWAPKKGKGFGKAPDPTFHTGKSKTICK